MDQLPVMLQALLAERFKLAVHKGDRSRSGYALVVDRNGPKFQEHDPKANFMGSNAGKMFFGTGAHGALKGVMTMATLASNLSREGYGQVEDATGLKGSYDIDLTWARDPALAPRNPVAPASPPAGADVAAPGRAQPLYRAKGIAGIETGSSQCRGAVFGDRSHRADPDGELIPEPPPTRGRSRPRPSAVFQARFYEVIAFPGIRPAAL